MNELPIPLPLHIEIGVDATLKVEFYVEPKLHRNRIVWLPVLIYSSNGEYVDDEHGKHRRSRKAAVDWLWEQREDMYCADPRLTKRIDP